LIVELRIMTCSEHNSWRSAWSNVKANGTTSGNQNRIERHEGRCHITQLARQRWDDIHSLIKCKPSRILPPGSLEQDGFVLRCLMRSYWGPAEKIIAWMSWSREDSISSITINHLGPSPRSQRIPLVIGAHNFKFPRRHDQNHLQL
jgi:hypothetical protein